MGTTKKLSTIKKLIDILCSENLNFFLSNHKVDQGILPCPSLPG